MEIFSHPRVTQNLTASGQIAKKNAAPAPKQPNARGIFVCGDGHQQLALLARWQETGVKFAVIEGNFYS
jgi:hypothetical protein